MFGLGPIELLILVGSGILILFVAAILLKKRQDG